MNNTKTWRKSTHSGAGNNCVELAVGRTATHVRDSKNPGHGRLTFADRPFRAFLTTLVQA
ncbi:MULTISPECIES: DUF397 domain-containing protein [Actinosynnema]|uniref:DUF397 domain-containing protein n=3 Tax=Actinosynnema TaxID=40566 RepID=C6WAG4_ACTMD|nr:MULTISPECIES: DUF397 domain-containing protein [Actinosynnema]AXX28809.1 hypothetical protein APASM_1444 [Actinosynnema pretiosum subsp. pretiosum]ACU35431.1 protein of unknown function DUF397 [Actinosynnema mirum DSM 43827]ATE53124.1 DUF397 domain-containing protein [Actinosynnema pretiosum]MCP2093257.1 protein of unknown function (DUF397) [Actinosynnema pretiosum]QUF06885.1 DUF397 domain-containing protein [Actinosynnema pretiosum subsp. pretiosum]